MGKVFQETFMTLFGLAATAVVIAAPVRAQTDSPAPANANPAASTTPEETQSRIDELLSRLTLAVPFATHHFPNDQYFNDQNSGAFADFKLNRQWSIVGGYFDNSYNKGTGFVGLAYRPIEVKLPNTNIHIGGMIGVDLTRGYAGYNKYDPALAAVSIMANFHDTKVKLFNRMGFAFTIIPPDPSGGSTAFNLAVTYRFH